MLLSASPLSADPIGGGISSAAVPVDPGSATGNLSARLLLGCQFSGGRGVEGLFATPLLLNGVFSGTPGTAGVVDTRIALSAQFVGDVQVPIYRGALSGSVRISASVAGSVGVSGGLRCVIQPGAAFEGRFDTPDFSAAARKPAVFVSRDLSEIVVTKRVGT